MDELPELYTASYHATQILCGGGIVPVRVSPEPPLVPLPYTVEETAWSVLPGYAMVQFEWPQLSPEHWRRLRRTGIETVAAELAEISARHGGKPLALLDHEEVEKAQCSPRITVAAFLEEQTGQAVPELLAGGEAIHYPELPKKVRPKPPQVDAEQPGPWPLSHSDVERWMERVPWQFAKSAPQNPHEYTLRKKQDDLAFLRVVLHLRLHGYQQSYGGAPYTVYDAGEFFIWSMGAVTTNTILINRKFHDPEEQALLAERQTGKSREEIGLDVPRREPPAAPDLFSGESEGR